MGADNFFEFSCPVKIISGTMAMSNVPHEMDQLGVHRAMVVTDKGVVDAGLIDIVTKAFDGSNCEIGAIFDKTPPDSSTTIVNEAAEIFIKENCDCFLAVGGGSAMDTAKCANIVVSEGTKDLMEFQGAERVRGPMKRFIAVPTTAGTGSEVTLVAMIYNVEEQQKMAFASEKLYPDLAIIDPRLTMTMPPKITAATGMDALTHAIESFYCLQKNPISDSLAITAIRLIMANLVKCTESGDDEGARLAMADGALIAGIAFSNSMVGVVHSLSHATGGIAHVPHGVANAIFLPFGMENNIDLRAGIIAGLAPHLCGREVAGSERERAEAAVGAIRDLTSKLNEICGLPTKLRDAGVKERDLEKIAAATINDGSLVYNPQEVTYDEALEIVKKAY